MTTLSAFNGLQRLLGLGLTGMAMGITFTSLLLDPPNTGNAQLRTAFALARVAAATASILTFVVGLHMTSLTFSTTLMEYMVQVPEMGVYLVCTLLCHQVFFLVFSYLLAYRIKSIVPWAGNRPRFVASFTSLLACVLLIPTVCMVVAVAQTPSITDFLVNHAYNRVTKAALAVQTCILGAISVTTDMTILIRLQSHRELLYNGHANADRAIRRIRKQMLMVSVNSLVTLAELVVRVVAVFSSYLGIDTYLKALAIAVDIHTVCHMGVTIQDVLRTPASSSGCLPPGPTIATTVLVSSKGQGLASANSRSANGAKAGANATGGATSGMSSSFMQHALSSMTSAMFRSPAGLSTHSTVHRDAAGPDHHHQPSPASQLLHHSMAHNAVGTAVHNVHVIVAIDEEESGSDCEDGSGA